MRTKLFCGAFLLFITVISNAQRLVESFEMPTPITTVYLKDIKVDAQNKILITGSIDYYEDTKQPDLIRLNADGTLDETFNFNSEFAPIDLYLLSTGEIIGASSDSIFKISASGLIIKSIEVASYSKIAIKDDNIYTVNRTSGLQKYDSNLILDSNFKQDNLFTGGTSNTVAIQGDKILVGGSFSEVNGMGQNDIARFDLDGNFDKSFETGLGTDDTLVALLVQDDGKIILTETYINSYNGNTFNGIIRLNPNGNLDTGFTPPYLNGPTRTALLQNDKILISTFFHDGTTTEHKLIRLNSDGTLDNTFNPIHEDITVSALTGDNDILTGAAFNQIGLNKYYYDGFLNVDFSSPITSIGFFENAAYHDGSIVVIGDFHTLGVNGHSTYQIGKLEMTGTVDENFTVTKEVNTGSVRSNRPIDIKIKGTDEIFVSLGNKILKLDRTGNHVSEFSTPPEVYDTRGSLSYFSEELEFYDNGQILTASSEGAYLLNPDGSQDTSFALQITGNGFGNSNGLDLQSSGKIIIGAGFNEINNIPKKGLVRLNADGTIDETFDYGDGPDFNRIKDVNVLQNDEIIIYPNYNMFNGMYSDLGIHKLGVDGSLDIDFLTKINSNFTDGSRYRFGMNYMGDSFLINYYDIDGHPFSLGKIDFYGNIDNNFSVDNDINLNYFRGGKGLFNVGDRMFLILGDLEIKENGELRKGALFIDDNSPIVTGTFENLTTTQNTSKLISITDLMIEDPDNVYPNDFELTVLGGENYSVSNNTIMPDPGFFGELTVNLVVNDGQGNSQPFQIKVEVEESLTIENEFLKNHFDVFPNPVNGRFSINTKKRIDGFDVNIFDIDGRIIYSRFGMKSGLNTIDVSHFQTGMYVLQIKSQNKTGIIKLIKR